MGARNLVGWSCHDSDLVGHVFRMALVGVGGGEQNRVHEREGEAHLQHPGGLLLGKGVE
jgi:hypothetical protein